MSDNTSKDIESQIDFVSKFLSLLFKTGVLLGGTCLAFYCYRLDYFPVGLTLGDGFLLILLASSFALIYGVFVISLVGLGLWMTPLLRPLQKLVYFVRLKFSKRKVEKPLDLVSPDISGFIFGFFGIVFILALGRVEPAALWKLPATAFFLGIAFSAIQNISGMLNDLIKKRNAKVLPQGEGVELLDQQIQHFRLARYLLLVSLLVAPLLVGGVSAVILENAMGFANIKKKPSYVMLRSPYSSFLPVTLQSKNTVSAPEYITFKDVDVMFSGLGQKTVIQYNEGKRVMRIEIPNESVLVIPR